jgi:hypothetical protein
MERVIRMDQDLIAAGQIIQGQADPGIAAGLKQTFQLIFFFSAIKVCFYLTSVIAPNVVGSA